MFIILFTYKKPLELVDQFIPQHIAFLEKGYQNNYFIVSGRQNPRKSAVIITKLKNRAEVEQLVQEHPFCINGVADYELIDFIPCNYQPSFEIFIN